MTKVTSGCTLASFMRRGQAVLANLANADEAADDTDMHDAPKHTAVSADRTDGRHDCRREAVRRLCRCKADLPNQTHAARVAPQKVPMCLPDTEAAASKPVECGPGARHDLVDPGFRRKGNPAAGFDHIVEEFGILAARLAARQAEAPVMKAHVAHPEQDVAG